MNFLVILANFFVFTVFGFFMVLVSTIVFENIFLEQAFP